MDRHSAFIDRYLIHLNGSKAYQETHLDAAPSTCRVNASKLLSNANIRAEINKRLKASHLSTEEALRLLADHAKGNINDFIDENGYVDLKKARAANAMHLLKEIEIIETETKDGVNTRIKVKLHDPQNAIDKVLRVQGKYKDTLDLNVKHKIIKVTPKKDDE